MSRETLLYTEMITAPALVRGRAHHLLDFNQSEHPVAVQLGGSDPAELAEATALAADAGYDEVNLNVGCPSDRVQSGCFGAVLMERPALVADCVAAMIEASSVDVTVKCRIGVDDQEPREVLPDFLERIRAAGVRRVAIHARKAWLQGLSPKENRDIPPLDYDLVYEMKSAFPDLHISINGGVTSLDEAEAHLARGIDGVMIGRSAYHDPSAILLPADRRIFGSSLPDRTAHEVVRLMLPYIEHVCLSGGRLHDVTRHMLGIFTGRPGARAWRRALSQATQHQGDGPAFVEDALALVPEEVEVRLGA